MPKATKVLPTAQELRAMLATRYSETAGNGAAWVLAHEVRNAAGFDANRTLDCVAMSLWPSRGLALHGFELKCSRSDWQREFADPSKAEAFHGVLDYFWLVVADGGIVHDGELPPDWGLLVARGGRLVQVQAPTRLREVQARSAKVDPLPPAFTRSYLAALLRAVSVGRDRTPAEVQAQVDAAYERGKRMSELEGNRGARRLEQLEATLRTLEDAAGVKVGGVNGGGSLYGGHHPAKIGRALRQVLELEDAVAKVQERLDVVVAQAEHMHRAVQNVASLTSD